MRVIEMSLFRVEIQSVEQEKYYGSNGKLDARQFMRICGDCGVEVTIHSRNENGNPLNVSIAGKEFYCFYTFLDIEEE